jgi:inorganic pyrophosphatase
VQFWGSFSRTRDLGLDSTTVADFEALNAKYGSVIDTVKERCATSARAIASDELDSLICNIGGKVAKKKKSLADPTGLKVEVKAGGKKGALLQVIVETPRGSRNKFAYDVKQRTYILKKVLPAGMTFPYDFGFLPRTIAGDGDPIDVLLMMDEPVFPGVVVPSRLIGVMEGQQLDGKKKIRNDRLVAVADGSHSYANIRKLKDLPKKWLKELEDFFVNYHSMEGKEYELLGYKGAAEAMTLIRKAEKAA